MLTFSAFLAWLLFHVLPTLRTQHAGHEDGWHTRQEEEGDVGRQCQREIRQASATLRQREGVTGAKLVNHLAEKEAATRRECDGPIR